jgi:hypothetical protein
MEDRGPLHLELEFVRAQDASERHGAKEGEAQEYLLRDPDGSGRYADGSFKWNARVMQSLAELNDVGKMETAVDRLAKVVRRFLNDTPWEVYEPLVQEALDEGRGAVITIRSAAAELKDIPDDQLGEMPPMDEL